jgi:RNA polymerase sigma-70 factor (ECF subfamily)
MNTTPVSLLERLRRPGETAAWNRFVRLYSPLIYHWARETGLQPSDAGDLVQDVFLVLLKQLPHFLYDPAKQNFRGWLRTVTLNKWRDRCRREAARPRGTDQGLLDIMGPEGDPAADAVYRAELMAQALKLMKAEFSEPTWKAFQQFVIDDRPAAQVAAELGMSVNSVYLAKSRVLRRLRQELVGLFE